MTYLEKPTPRLKERKPLKSRPYVIPDRVRFQVYKRSGYVCEWCGVAGGRLDLHHRLRRSQGGKDNPGTLAAVHRACHERIHNAPLEAKQRGFLVRSEDEL